MTLLTFDENIVEKRRKQQIGFYDEYGKGLRKGHVKCYKPERVGGRITSFILRTLPQQEIDSCLRVEDAD